MFSLKAKTRQNIEKCVAVPFSNIIAMDSDDEKHFIKSVKGDVVVFSEKRNPRKMGRGNPYLARRRFRTIEEVEERLEEICSAGAESRL